jgi:hypothetical protein
MVLHRGVRAIKDVLKKTFLLDVVKYIRQRGELQHWRKSGRPVPPPHLLKQRTIKHYARRFGMRTLVETGTFLGDMIDATKGIFDRIFSIELDKTLYEHAKERFSRFDHISVVQGNSGQVLLDILADIQEPCLFWLDAHYSSGITARADLETPVVQELRYISEHSVTNHVVLIDDARFFVGKNDYPTLEELRDLIARNRPGWVLEVRDDIIRIHDVLET